MIPLFYVIVVKYLRHVTSLFWNISPYKGLVLGIMQYIFPELGLLDVNVDQVCESQQKAFNLLREDMTLVT